MNNKTLVIKGITKTRRVVNELQAAVSLLPESPAKSEILGLVYKTGRRVDKSKEKLLKLLYES